MTYHLIIVIKTYIITLSELHLFYHYFLFFKSQLYFKLKCFAYFIFKKAALINSAFNYLISGVCCAPLLVLDNMLFFMFVIIVLFVLLLLH